MSHKTTFIDPIPQGATRFIQGYLLDQDDDPIVPAQLDALTLTLYNLDDARTVINGVDDSDIKNVGRGTIDSTGFLTVELTPADNVILDDTKVHETHRALIEWTYGTTRKGKHEVEFIVINLEKVS